MLVDFIKAESGDSAAGASGVDVLFRDFRILGLVPGAEAYGFEPNADCVLVRDGLIVAVGKEASIPVPDSAHVVRGNGRFLSPGLIDCHTHLVYGGNRADEWSLRMEGVPYETIACRGGGILSTVRATRDASEEELFLSARKRLSALIRQGVTTVEIKSGYGLNTETELKMLRVAGRLNDELPISVRSTLLAAHCVPPEFAGRPDEYVSLVCEEMIPAAVGLCQAVDVFCETIAFDLEQTERVFEAALTAGLDIKVHAEQLSHSGAAALAARLGAVSVDHLEYLSSADCRILAKFGTTAVLLPGAFYSLRETQKPPVAALREAGVGMAIATDANPGSSPVGAILLMANMACTLFGMTPEEAIAGLTRNAAQALGLAQVCGTIEVGKRADLAVWDIESPGELAYGIGRNPCEAVYCAGRLVFETNTEAGADSDV